MQDMNALRIILAWKIDLYPDRIIDFYELDFEQLAQALTRDVDPAPTLIDLKTQDLYLHDQWLHWNRLIPSWNLSSEIDFDPSSVLPETLTDTFVAQPAKTACTLWLHPSGVLVLRADWGIHVRDDFDYRSLEELTRLIGDYYHPDALAPIAHELAPLFGRLRTAMNKRIPNQVRISSTSPHDYDVIDWDQLYVLPECAAPNGVTSFLEEHRLLHGLRDDAYDNLLTTGFGHLVIGYDGSVFIVRDQECAQRKATQIAQLMEIAGGYVQAMYATNIKLRGWVGDSNHLFPKTTQKLQSNVEQARRCGHYVDLLTSDANSEFIAADQEHSNILSACYRHWKYETTLGETTRKAGIVAQVSADLHGSALSKKASILNSLVIFFTIITFSSVVATVIEAIDFENTLLALTARGLLILSGTLGTGVLILVYLLIRGR